MAADKKTASRAFGQTSGAAPRSLFSRAIDCLSRREHSRAELWRKLEPHAESAEALEAVLARLVEAGYQSDERFAEQYAHAKGQRHGGLRLSYDLRQKGVAETLIKQAIAGHDDKAVARQLWQKKFNTAPTTQQEKAKQIRYLASRGIPPNLIFSLLKEVGSADFDDEHWQTEADD